MCTHAFSLVRTNTGVLPDLFLHLQNLLGDIFKAACKKITDLHKEELIFCRNLLQSLLLWLKINILGVLREKKIL